MDGGSAENAGAIFCLYIKRPLLNQGQGPLYHSLLWRSQRLALLQREKLFTHL
jgi:hypothetical protein